MRGGSCISGSSLLSTEQARGFAALGPTHPCNCVPGDHAGGLAGWFTDRIRQWIYIREVEFSLLRQSIARQQQEFLEEVGSVWHEWVCFRWGRTTLQDLTDLDALERSGLQAPCPDEPPSS